MTDADANGNGSPIKQGGKFASGVVDALKTQPLVLALVVFNALFIIASYFGFEHARDANTKLVETMLGQQSKFADMLYHCTPNLPPTPSPLKPE